MHHILVLYAYVCHNLLIRSVFNDVLKLFEKDALKSSINRLLKLKHGLTFAFVVV